MSDYRQPVQDYILACEAILKMGDLSEEEAEVVEDMYGQIADKFIDAPESCRCSRDSIRSRFNPSVNGVILATRNVSLHLLLTLVLIGRERRKGW